MPLDVWEGCRSKDDFGENSCLCLGPALAPFVLGEPNPLPFLPSLATVQGRLKQKAWGEEGDRIVKEEDGKA